MQNGVGSAEAARDVLGSGTPVFSTAIWIGMQRVGLTQVAVNAHSGPVQTGALLGDDIEAVMPMLALAERGFVPMAHAPDIEKTVFGKLLFNSCMNPTGALIGRNYGELLENQYSREIIGRLADEALRVFAARNGFRPADNGKHYV
jgi:2-dehydropantoate 2-reductase